MTFIFHEQLYRSPQVMALIRDFKVTICGAGALGANIVENLARSGFAKIKVIDRDRIEERNLSTQPYYKSDIGAYKVKILSNSIYRALGTMIEPSQEELTLDNAAKLLQDSQLVIDTFDNSVSRKAVADYCSKTATACLHAGLAGDYSEVIWNDIYTIPSDAQDDICDYPLARNLVMVTVAITCEAIIEFIATKSRNSYTFTLKDFAIKTFG